jgi:hypothetical protein
MYYTTKIGESKWGVSTSLAFNKRGYKEVDLINRTSTNSLGTKYFLKEFQSIYYNYATSVIIAPTFQLSDKLIAMIGFHYTYSFGPNSKDIHNYFETDENGDNKVLYNTRKFKYGNNGISFVDNSYYGIKAAIFYQVSGIIDFGLAYQYSRPFKSNSYGSTRFYNIINITTTIYFKTRE